MSTRPKLVLLGMMTKMPVAGVVWQTVHYLLGFERLGYETYYVEAHARTPSMLMQSPQDDSSARAASFIDALLRRFGLGDRWAFQALHDDGRCYGLSEQRLEALYRDAALIVNLHGGTEPQPAHAASGRLVYLETDPVQLQVELHDGLRSTVEFLEPHCAFFTFAENLGGADCGLPVSSRYRFHTTRQPVLLDLWDSAGVSTRPAFTTIGNWQQQWRSVSLDGEEYHWSKHHEFLKVLELPARTGRRFELALASLDAASEHRKLLTDHGWRVRDALSFSTDVDDYRKYIATSRAEFTVAKDQNVRLRSGWFSDRSATYLASGRPVITQDTGFGCALPVGEGLLAYTTLEEAADAVDRIDSDYRAHRRAAAEIAREFFDANIVLSQLLDDVGLGEATARRRRPESADVPTTVAVVIPCRDLGGYLPEAVGSVLAQTRPPDELVVVDDGSEDASTLEVLERLEAEGVHVLRTERLGAPSARNHGIRATQSEYVLCLDADDVLGSEFLERTVAALDAAPEAAIVTTHVEFFGDRAGIWETSGYDPALLMRENCIASASLFRRVAWRETPGYADLRAAQDWDLWLSMVERGWRWECVPEVLYRYRVRSGSISDTARTRRREVVQAVLSRHADSYRRKALPLIADLDAEVMALRTVAREQEQAVAAKDSEILQLRDALAAAQAREAPPVPAGALERAAEVFGADASKRADVVVRGDALFLAFDGERPLTTEAVARAAREGAEVLVAGASAASALERRREVGRALELRWHGAVRDARHGVLFDLRAELVPPTFSVVICTHGRPAALADAVHSVLAQEYPRDRFELLVVDNEPSAAAQQVAAEAGVAYHVELRPGLSHARNAGIARARGEYVAFLDDDAVASRHWLAAFGATIRQHGALVVGGRVTVRVAGGDAPAWLSEQYPRGFFGIDYAEWGRRERVFRVQRPLYLGGGNSVYARRLFRHFGGFPAELGRTASTLRAGEETYLNALLERHDVPLHYDADAVVEHVVDAARLTRSQLRRKAYWAGRSDALLARLLGEETKGGWRPAGSAVVAAMRARGARLVTPELRAAHAAGAARGTRRSAKPPLPAPQWSLEDWLAEVRSRPHGLDRVREEANTLVALDREDEAAEQLARLDQLASALAADNVNRSLASRRLLRAQYEQLVRDIHALVEDTVPAKANVAVVSKGDDRLLDFPGRNGWHFPQDAQGVWAGHYPADSAAAIAHVEDLRRRGAGYIVFPVTSLWWLEHYAGLAAHLDREYRLVRSGEPCTMYELAPVVREAPPTPIAVTA